MFAKKLVKSAGVSIAAIAMAFSLFATLLPTDSLADAKSDFSIDGFLYSYVNKNNHSAGVSLVGYTGNRYLETVLEVESTVYYGGENLKVVSIGPSAFKTNAAINTLIIDEGIVTIGKSAFEECQALTEIQFPKSLETIADSAFKNCEQLANLDLSNTSLITTDTSITVHDKAKNTAVFSGCKNLKTIKFPTNEEFRIIPAEWFKNCTELSDITIPGNIWELDVGCFQGDIKIEKITLSNGVILLDDKSFSGCNSLKSVTAPTSLMVLGKESFYQCTTLEEFKIPNGTNIDTIEDGAFKGASKLKQFILPGSCTVKTIESEAFADCKALTKVVLQTNTVESFGAKAFANCPVLTDVTIPTKLKGVGNECFAGDVLLNDISLPDTVVTIGQGAFKNCKKFTTFVVPSQVRNIGQSTFEGCVNLKNISISNVAQTIGHYAFNGCTALSGSIKLPETLVTLGKGAFMNCSKVTGINIPSNVTQIGDECFSGCASLKSISIPAKVDRIYPSTFYGCSSLTTVSVAAGSVITVIDESAFSGCTALQSINLPSALNSLGSRAFYNCKALKALSIPAGVTTINKSLCENCESLANLTLGSNTTIISSSAFKGCKSLASVNIPAGVTAIPDECFSGCTSLVRANMGSAVTSISDKAFYGCTKLCSDNGVLALPSNLKALGVGSFGNCSNIKEVTIPSAITAVPETCFSNCSKLSKLNINKVNTVGKAAFRGCTALADVDLSNIKNYGEDAFNKCGLENAIIAEGVTSIPKGCFSGNANLVYAKIPSTVSTIGANAFSSCNLKAIEIPDNVTSVDKTAFSNNKSLSKIKVENNQVTVLQYLGSNTSVEIPDVIYGMNVTVIADEAFRDTKVKQVHLPATVKAICSRAFMDCQSLLTVRFPDSAAVAEDAFEGCSTVYKLKDAGDKKVSVAKFYGEKKTVNIPKQLEGCAVVGIGDSAFEGNTLVTDVYVPATVTSIGNKAFKGCSRADVSYPSSAALGNQAFDGCKSATAYKGNSGPTDPPTPTTKKNNNNTGDSMTQIKNFVQRIYTNVLNRQADADGIQYWADELYAFRKSGAEVAQGFIFSDEFINRGTSDKQFIEILYSTFFDRQADEGGMNYWLKMLSQGQTRQDVANGFIFSQEWADTCATYGIRSGAPGVTPKVNINPTAATVAFVERMYTTAMKREYDKSGRDYWASELANFKITGEQVGASFFLSDEMNGYNLDNGEYINRLYKTFMDRDADQGGKDYWMSFLAEGHSRQEAVFGFTRSPEFQQKCVDARILPFQ